VSKVIRAPDKSAFEVIDINQIPTKTTRKKQEWLRLFEQIPEGRAIVTTPKQLGVAAKSVSSTLRRYIREGVLPDTYKVMRRREGNITTIYILHVGKPSKEESD